MPPIPRAGFYRGEGGYEYIVGGQGEITIAKSPRGKAGTVVELDSPFYDVIAKELAGKQNMASGIPTSVSERLKGAAMPAAPKASVTGMPEEMGVNTAEDLAAFGRTEGVPAEMEAEYRAPSGRSSAAVKEAYGDRLLGDMNKVGQYGSGAAPKPAPVVPGASGAMVDAAAKGLMGMGVSATDAYRMVGDAQKGVNAETILKGFAALRPVGATAAPAMGPSKEMSKYLGGSNEAAAARTQLEKDAIAGLTAQGKSTREAQMMVADKMGMFRSTAGKGTPDRAAFDALLQYAGMSAGGSTARPAQVAAR
jgi:hypothetical protein